MHSMTAENRQPYSRRGGIEASMGARLHPGIVEDFNETPLDVKPFDPAESAEAIGIYRLYSAEPSVLCDKYGNPWMDIIVPCKRKEDAGQLLEMWTHPKDIFTTRDSIIHIIEAYSRDGIQYKKRVLAVKTMNNVVDRLQEGPIPDEERQEFKERTIKGMVDSGYLSSVYPERVETAEDLIRATEKDSLGRPNSSRGRVIADTRRPQLIKDGLVVERILKKNRRRLSAVEAICDWIEQDFENLARFSEDLAENKIGTGNFDAELPGYRSTVFRLLSPANSVLPKPYSELGAKVRYAMHPKHRIDDPITLSRYMDPMGALDVRDQFEAGFDEIDATQQRERIIDIAGLIKNGLKSIALQRFGEEVA